MANLRNKDKLSIIHGDLFKLDVEAIVNPTNTDLLLGAGLGGQIRKRGGSEIQEECLEIHSVSPGRAAVTSGGALKVKHIIHAAIMKIGGFTTEEFLVGAIKSTGNRIRELSLKTVAFPPMGTGVGRFPLRRGAEVMIETILDAVCGIRNLEAVYIVLEDDEMCSLFEDTYTRITGEQLTIEITPSDKAPENETILKDEISAEEDLPEEEASPEENGTQEELPLDENEHKEES